MNSSKARRALDNLIDAFEEHFSAVVDSDSILDDEVVAAEEDLQDAFFVYDSALFDETGVELPFDIMDEDDDLGVITTTDEGDLVLSDGDYDDDEDDEDDYEEYDLEYDYDDIEDDDTQDE